MQDKTCCKDNWDKVLARADKVLEIAKRMAEELRKNNPDYGYMVVNRLEYITLYVNGYSEPGYTSKYNIVATGNWNKVDRYDREKKERVIVSDLPERVSKIFEKLGVECEWSDEWCECYDCGKLLRTQPDNWFWKPSFTLDDNGAHCRECQSEKENIDETYETNA